MIFFQILSNYLLPPPPFPRSRVLSRCVQSYDKRQKKFPIVVRVRFLHRCVRTNIYTNWTICIYTYRRRLRGYNYCVLNGENNNDILLCIHVYTTLVGHLVETALHPVAGHKSTGDSSTGHPLAPVGGAFIFGTRRAACTCVGAQGV